MDVEPKFCFVVGWGGEVLHFGCRAQILFCGWVGWGRYYILDVEPKFCFLVGWGGMGRYYILDKTKLIARLVLRQKSKIYWPILRLAELVFFRASTM